MHTKQCFVCGYTATNHHYEYYNFCEVLEKYRVGYTDLCGKCRTKADGFINYYGHKKPEDVARLHQYLVSGILPIRDYSTLMNAGYYE